MSETEETKRQHFIRQIIEDDLQSARHTRIHTRFPPEPNGYLHIGHAKSICVNFGLAKDYNGLCNLRFDDTNPEKEEDKYVQGIITDVRWLGFDWGEKPFYTSEYFETLYECALHLIKQGKAYVDALSPDEIREYRGTLQEPGKNSPHRDRPIEENLDLFQRMRAGEFKEGELCLRARIDMSSGNINLRDPILYRIRFAHHQHTQDEWCIYPMYDFAHPISDALESITHSICTLEFQDHRPLYDWLIENLELPAEPKQYEMARFNLSHTITSKRKLRELVEGQFVAGWDDPRLPTLRGMRKRGYPAAAIRNFCDSMGVSKSESVIDMNLLEAAVRDELNQTANRAMAVLNPLKIIITNYPEDSTEQLSASNHPQDPEKGQRHIPFSRELYIEREDFMETPEKKFFRLAPGKEVRLRSAYVIKCDELIKDAAGNIIELHCSYDPNTLGKKPEGRKVKGVIHWVAAKTAVKATVNLYDRLFTIDSPGRDENFTQHINPHSLTVLDTALVEPSLLEAAPGEAFQFERLGYFVREVSENDDKLIFNRTVSLRDTWAKISAE